MAVSEEELMDDGLELGPCSISALLAAAADLEKTTGSR
jgi:hypothetical protein